MRGDLLLLTSTSTEIIGIHFSDTKKKLSKDPPGNFKYGDLDWWFSTLTTRVSEEQSKDFPLKIRFATFNVEYTINASYSIIDICECLQSKLPWHVKSQ